MNVAILFHRFGPYHCARICAAARNMTVIAIEMCGRDATYEWDVTEGVVGFRKVTLFPDIDVDAVAAPAVSQRICSLLTEESPDVVVVAGWAANWALSAISWAVKMGRPVVMLSESAAADSSRNWWQERIKKRVVSLCRSALVGGVRHKEYIVQLGMPMERVFLGYDVVDNTYFSFNAGLAREHEMAMRERYGLPGRYFLAINRFIEKKNLPFLFRAYADYVSSAASDPWKLVLLGSGELEEELITLRAELGLEHDLLLPGFKQYPDLPVFYGLAGVFLHVSMTEQWGLVVNEAMASGLPVLVSNRCGCVPELVHEGVNGFTFDPCDQNQLSELMVRITSGGCDRAAMERQSRKIIQAWSPDRFARGLKQAVDAALSAPSPQWSLFDEALLWALARR